MGDISDNFNRKEFECKCGCGKSAVDVELITILELVRLYFGAPVYINSGNRCERHNAQEGGSEYSQHLYSKAADIRVLGVEAEKVYDFLDNQFKDKYGVGLYPGRIHIDVRPHRARWKSNI